MARIIPSDISPLALAGAHSGELQTLASPIRCPGWVWKSAPIVATSVVLRLPLG